LKLLLHWLFRLVAVLSMTVALASCGDGASYRYKLTLAVNTPEGVKRGSSVVEEAFWNVSIPERGTPHKLRGEALYLDLGPGARPLIALLTSQLHRKREKDQSWTRDAGPDHNLIARIYGETLQNDLLDYVRRVARMRGPRQITAADLPDLVTLADTNDPSSVIEVDPNNLQATLGSNVTWNEITLESTDEPITKGLRAKLPWIEPYFQQNLRLDGLNHGFNKGLANTLNWADFDLSGDLKRNR
jgi:hypothetical protein